MTTPRKMSLLSRLKRKKEEPVKAPEPLPEKTEEVVKKKPDYNKMTREEQIQAVYEDRLRNIPEDLASYKARGCKCYVFRALYDPSRLCPVCAALDGKTFLIDDAEPGVNCPPMHVGCLCYYEVDTTPWMKEYSQFGKREITDWETGQRWAVPEDYTYAEWYYFIGPGRGDGIIYKADSKKYKGPLFVPERPEHSRIPEELPPREEIDYSGMPLEMKLEVEFPTKKK